MKKSKKLTIILLVLAIVTALSAGTLAIYTTTLDDQMHTAVDAKEMYICNGETWHNDLVISMAPGDDITPERVYNLYTAKDKNNLNTVTEVPVDVTFTPNDSFANLIRTCEGLEIKLLENKEGEYVVTNTWNAANPQGTYVYPETLEANSNNHRQFKLEFVWNTTVDQQDNSAQGAAATIGFAVNATQHVDGNAFEGSNVINE